MKFSELLLRYLSSAGIKYVFGIIGREAEAILFDEHKEGMRFVLTRHETTAGVAATAMARFTNSPQVCFGTLGPGATNYMTTLGTAALDRNPLIVIAAQIETKSIMYNDAHQCIDAVSMAKPICKYTYELKHKDELKGVLEQAISASMSLPYGPSFISIPIDILSSEVEPLGVKLATVATISTTTEVEKPLKEAVKMIDKAKNPVIVVGDTITKIKGADDLIKKFVLAKNIPITTTYHSKGILPLNHKLNFGVINSYANVLLEEEVKQTQFNEADLIILLGYDLAEHYPNAWREGVPKLKININPYLNASESVLSPDLTITSPLNEAVIALTRLCKMHPARINRMKVINTKIQKMLSDKTKYKEGIMVNQIIGSLDEHYKDYILANDIGMHRHVTALYYQPKKAGEYVTSAGFSSFGTGLPMGLGAKLANPNRNVVVIAGDGGFHSNSGDLETLARLKIKMPIILLNNSLNGLIKRYQLTGKERRSNSDVVQFTKVDFVKLAEANNCQGIKVNSLKELSRALTKADKFDGPTLIEVEVHYPDMYINSHSVIFKKS